MSLVHLLSVWMLSAPAPGAPDLCPGTMADAVFQGSYGNMVGFISSLTLRDTHGEFRAQIFLTGHLTTTTDSAGLVTAADLKPSLSVVYLGNKPVNFAAESWQGDCSLDKAASATDFTLACVFTPGSGVVRVESSPQKATLTFSVRQILCGTLLGSISFSFVQAKLDAWAKMGMEVTKHRTVATFALNQKSGAFFDARSAQDVVSDKLEALLDPSYRPPISDALVGRAGAIARDLDAALRKQPDPRVRHCLQVHHRNRVNLFVRARSRASIAALVRESHESAAFIRGGQGVADLLRWLNLLTAAGVEACSESTQNDLVSSLRRKLEMVVEFSLMPGVPAVDVLPVLNRVPVVGAVAGPLVRQVPAQVRDFGEERIRDEVKKLQRFRKPADLCDRKVAATWSRAEAIEALVNRLTAARFRIVADHRRKVSPKKTGCK